jgi:hypothetical protein
VEQRFRRLHTPKAENDLRTGGKFVSRMEAKDGSMGIWRNRLACVEILLFLPRMFLRRVHFYRSQNRCHIPDALVRDNLSLIIQGYNVCILCLKDLPVGFMPMKSPFQIPLQSSATITVLLSAA